MINLKNENGKIYCSSREVANDFKKRHDNVMDKIKENIKHFNALNFKVVDYFEESTYQDKKNETRKEYLLTKDGFSLIVMGFTGLNAFKWKIEYIKEFNRLENELNEYIKQENNDLHKDINILENTYMELNYRNKRSLTENVCYPILNELGINKKNRFYCHDKIKNIVTGGAYEKIVRVDGFNVPEFRLKYLNVATEYSKNNPQYFQQEKNSQIGLSI